jgi:N-hydroxyarylamine O-acetyltransferase
MLDVRNYLARIGYDGPTTPTLDTLRRLHRTHLLAVPFENLDIGLKRKITMDEAAFVRKVVEKRRGGFCYELNGAFGAFLRALGYTFSLLSCRVAREDGSDGLDFGHMALLVECEGCWLADVGFGDSYLEPLRMESNIEQPQDGRMFRIAGQGEALQVERAEPDGSWKRLYSFSLQPHGLEEFAGMCHYHQTSPQSHFTQKRICTRATPEGRVTLADLKLIVTRNGKREEHDLAGEQEWKQALAEHFRIVLE